MTIIVSVVDIQNRKPRLLLYKCSLFAFTKMLGGGGAKNPQGGTPLKTPAGVMNIGPQIIKKVFYQVMHQGQDKANFFPV